MSFQQSYIAEFDHEAKSTRKLLERVPADKFDWQPHAKSMKLGSLANHIAAMAGRPEAVLTQTDVDTQSPQTMAQRAASATTPAELIERWDKGFAAGRKAVETATEEQLAETYTLRAGEKVIFTLPRRVALRTIVLNHLIHHRGQLSVYLRLLDVPIPSIYGPSADEKL